MPSLPRACAPDLGHAAAYTPLLPRAGLTGSDLWPEGTAAHPVGQKDAAAKLPRTLADGRALWA